MGYQDNYAANVANIYQNLGNAQAQAHLRKGDVWANAFGQLGQIAAGIPGQLQNQKDLERQREREGMQDEVTRINLDRLRRGETQQGLLANVMQSSVVNGKIDETRFVENAQKAGIVELVPEALKVLRESERAAIDLKTATMQGRLTQAQLSQLEMNYIQTLAPAAVAAKFDPEVVNALLLKAELDGFDVSAWKSMMQSDPQRFAQTLTNMATPRPEPFTLSAGQTRYGVDGKPIASQPSEVKLDRQAIMVNGRPMMANFNPQTGEYFKPGSAEPLTGDIRPVTEPRQPTYEWATDPRDGKVKFLSREEIVRLGATKPLSDAQQTRETSKEQLVGVFTALSDLSQKINTLEGVMASAAGAVEKEKAKVNLNNDVAEYQSIISAFTPIVARAVGHQGVLTQVDVDSVKAMFPSPTDGKELRDRKIKRLNELLQLRGATPASTNLVSPTTPPPDQSGTWKWNGTTWVKR